MSRDEAFMRELGIVPEQFRPFITKPKNEWHEVAMVAIANYSKALEQRDEATRRVNVLRAWLAVVSVACAVLCVWVWSIV